MYNLFNNRLIILIHKQGAFTLHFILLHMHLIMHIEHAEEEQQQVHEQEEEQQEYQY